MPNYSLVANNVFQRRSFDELMKPLAMYAEEYNKIENAIGELDTKASVWEGMANEERDPVAYAQYKRYADDLREQATLLANNGLNPMTRRNLLGLKSRYASEIAPIEQAYANRKAQAEEQRKALLQNPTLLLSRRADMTSLDQYLNNPELSYDSYSGALLTQQVGTAAANLAKQLRSYGNGQPLDAYTKTWLQQHGYTADEVAMAINNPNDSRSSKVLTSLVNNVIADSGIPQWADKATLNQAYNYANQGLWQAVGNTEVGSYANHAQTFRDQEEVKYTDWLRQLGLEGISYNPETDEYSYDANKDITLKKNKALATAGLNSKGNSVNADTNSTVVTYNDNGSATKTKLTQFKPLPLYLDAWDKYAANGFDVFPYGTKNSASVGDLKKFSFSHLNNNEEAKKPLRAYLKEQMPQLANLSDDKIDRILALMDFKRDYDVFSDNHFRLQFPGIDDEGKMENSAQFNNFINEVNNIVKETSDISNLQPAK